MTLVVSLRIPDGIVLSADSLQTTIGSFRAELRDFKTVVEGKKLTIPKLSLPPMNIPSSTSSYAQKIFPFKNKFGIAIFGSNVLNKRTIYNHLKSIESSLGDDDMSLHDVGSRINDYFVTEVKKQIDNVPNVDPRLPIFGLQIIGFKNGSDITGTTLEYQFGVNSQFREHADIGCTVSGDNFVALKVFEAQQRSPINFGAFSLQDGIDFCEFLTNTTADYQRFANMIPTVGGAVDIGLITQYGGFKWIKVKELTRIMEQ